MTDLSVVSPMAMLIGVVFLASGATKLLAVRRFRDSLGSLGVLPDPLLAPFAWALPVTELLLGATALAGHATRPAQVLVLALLAAFTSVLVYHRARGGLEIACGCFGELDDSTSTSRLILRNVLLGVAGGVWIAKAPPVPPTFVLADRLHALSVAIGLCLVWMLSVRLVEALRLLASDADSEISDAV